MYILLFYGTPLHPALTALHKKPQHKEQKEIITCLIHAGTHLHAIHTGKYKVTQSAFELAESLGLADTLKACAARKTL